ncbi:PHP domain-containing protein [Eubacterium sp. AB3007]|uniref:PHP domain-containing protein n=1 Tax=Eubacterium sp. AB3007 TaxID=1392487 RepID=UPI00068FC110|nr:PHP domain-containing protein [Eubacterium sp. AB3007]MBQ1472109.1 PHP domain-containing protein [Eubacterium sp.]
MGLKMDLHMHSTFSDGTMRPVDLVKKYHAEEYSLIALTDHDGIGGVKEAQIAGEALGVQVISGIELSTLFEGRTKLHILGYYIDIENKALNEKLEKILAARVERNQKLLKVFQDKGIDITYEDLLQRPGQTYVGKPNFALAFQKMGLVEKPADAFQSKDLLGSPEAEAVRKEPFDSIEAVKLLREAGGIPSLAHPLKIKGIGEPDSEEFYENLDGILRALKKAGLKGLECFHPSATHEQGIRLVKFAEKYHLHVTEGSDYHGPEFE